MQCRTRYENATRTPNRPIYNSKKLNTKCRQRISISIAIKLKYIQFETKPQKRNQNDESFYQNRLFSKREGFLSKSYTNFSLPEKSLF